MQKRNFLDIIANSSLKECWSSLFSDQLLKVSLTTVMLRYLVQCHEYNIENRFKMIIRKIKIALKRDHAMAITQWLHMYLCFRCVFIGDTKRTQQSKISIMHLKELLELIWLNCEFAIPIIYQGILFNKASDDELRILYLAYKHYSNPENFDVFLKKIFWRGL